ncbi:MAG: ATP synthase F0 subunit B [Proteobacteria bacterium]|jgi:F-type H+-transporting ATPase subunit b|nr:ATP synthase F0 subunit B [Pseudomonadota bacterium]
MHATFPEIAAIFNFLFLAIALGFLLKKPLKGFMAERSDVIRQNVEESERLQQEALTMLKNYEGKLAKLDAEIKEMMDNARKEGEKEKAEILARAERMSVQIIENAKNMADRELLKQKDTLQRELMAKVIAEAMKTLKDKASEKDHKAFTTQFITQMEKQNGDIN